MKSKRLHRSIRLQIAVLLCCVINVFFFSNCLGERQSQYKRFAVWSLEAALYRTHLTNAVDWQCEDPSAVDETQRDSEIWPQCWGIHWCSLHRWGSSMHSPQNLTPGVFSWLWTGDKPPWRRINLGTTVVLGGRIWAWCGTVVFERLNFNPWFNRFPKSYKNRGLYHWIQHPQIRG